MKKILLLVIIFFSVAPIAHADITSNLNLWYKFDDGSGVTAVDSSGNSNTADLIGDGIAFTTAKIGTYSMNFDGTNDWAQSTIDSPANGATSLTVAMWINNDIIGSGVILAEDGESYNSNSFYFYLNNGRPEFEVFGSTGVGYDIRTATNVITAETWVHVAGVWSQGSRVKLYINGVEDTGGSTVGVQQNTALYDSNKKVYISARQSGAGVTLEYNGKIDDFRIYNRALSASDIAELYAYPPAETAQSPSFLMNVGMFIVNSFLLILK